MSPLLPWRLRVILKHIGIRPLHKLTVLDFKKKIFYEEYPDDTFKLWNERMLNSGCNTIVADTTELMDCYYCPACDEYFSKNQWETLG